MGVLDTFNFINRKSPRKEDRQSKFEEKMTALVEKAKKTRKKKDILKAEEFLDRGLKDNWL
ncbi:MAG TPA: hypothetical protein VMW50_11560 [Dehalococcoidia bacterium]|nr:hypothetical protein [Dehalococcoidia bacterium]